jgi:type IV secretory pathway TrbF-like protein
VGRAHRLGPRAGEELALMAFGSLILSAGFASALVWQSARGTVVPWVVQVDNLGQAQTVAPANADYRPTDPQIAFHLGRFIEQVRAIPADAIIVRQNWLRAYEWTTDRGAAALNDYARANDPFTKVGRQQSPSRCRRSSAPRRTASASPGPSATTRTASFPRPSAGPRS